MLSPPAGPLAGPHEPHEAGPYAERNHGGREADEVSDSGKAGQEYRPILIRVAGQCRSAIVRSFAPLLAKCGDYGAGVGLG